MGFLQAGGLTASLGGLVLVGHLTAACGGKTSSEDQPGAGRSTVGSNLGTAAPSDSGTATSSPIDSAPDLGDAGADPYCFSNEAKACACPSGALGTQLCAAPVTFGTYGPCACDDSGPSSPEQQLRKGIVGTWVGTQAHPASWDPTVCPCTVTFTTDGHYSAHSPGDSCTVFYWGLNDDDPAKTYAVSATAPGAGSGTISLLFFHGNASFPTGSRAAQLENIVLSPDGSSLTFDVLSSGNGPLSFSLQRALVDGGG